MKKLSNPQYEMLLFYEEHGPTTRAFGSLLTWEFLLREGFLQRSVGLTETEITNAGLRALRERND